MIDTPPRLGTTDDVAALEEIMSLSGFHADTLEVANIRLERIFRLAHPRLGTIDDRRRVELLERVRSAAQAYVDAPAKFGVRYRAYRSLVKALAEWDDLHGRQEP